VSEQPAPRSWLGELEGVRAFAYAFIVFSHAFATLQGIPHSVLSIASLGVVLAVTRPAVPAFLTISSLLLARKVYTQPKPQLWPNARRLLVAYVSWTVLYVLFSRVLHGTPAVMAWDLVVTILQFLPRGGAAAHLWYLVVALQLYLVVPVLTWLVQDRPRSGLVLFLVAAVCANMVILGQVNGPLGQRPVLDVFFGANADKIATTWLAYIAVGTVCGLDYETVLAWLERHRVAIVSAWLVAATGLAWLVVTRSYAMGGEYYTSIDPGRITQAWIVPFELLSIAAWILLARPLMRTRLARPLGFVAAVSFGGYLIHPLFLYAGSQYLYSHWTAPDPYVTVMSLFAFSLVGATVSSWLLGRGQLGAALVGARPPKRRQAETPAAAQEPAKEAA
jgi:peptidoglycan/LPS O-acetylase OafA/YrhL